MARQRALPHLCCRASQRRRASQAQAAFADAEVQLALATQECVAAAVLNDSSYDLLVCCEGALNRGAVDRARTLSLIPNDHQAPQRAIHKLFPDEKVLILDSRGGVAALSNAYVNASVTPAE